MYIKKGYDFEIIAKEFLENIFEELKYKVVRNRNQNSGTQDGFDVLTEIVDKKYKHYFIYSECKDYSNTPSYNLILEKIPKISSTHERIDLFLFISPHKNFSNPHEPSKFQHFYNKLSDLCPVEFLTPDSQVEDYFSLYPSLYHKVYDKNPTPISIERRQELLEDFDKFIFSDKNLRKIIIEESDRSTYIGYLKEIPYHINRTYRSLSEENIYLWENPDYSIEIESLLSAANNENIVVLGSPGYGKTTELKFLALKLWGNRDEDQIIPKYHSLKNFHSTSTIESILPSNYSFIPYLLVILDGLDEVHDTIDFSNKLSDFIAQRKNSPQKNIIKFIVSCRTSIYNKVVKHLDGFSSIYLNPVAEGRAIHFLNNKFGIDLLKNKKEFSFWRYRDILQNPFYLELIGNNYQVKKEIILSKAKLIDQYIINRLEEDYSVKYRNDTSFNADFYLEQSKQLSFAMESMQRSGLSDGEARAILGDTNLLIKNPFVEQDINRRWSFEHKNIQESFVAKSLSKLSFDAMISLIKIDPHFEKVHPTWHNVVALLLNIRLEPKTYHQLIEWVFENDIELVFNADSDLVSEEIRNKSLQMFFQKNCLDRTLWINDEATVAKFGDTQTNIQYLFEKALDKSLNLRIRLSAILLLSNMSISTETNAKSINQLLKQITDEFKNNTIEFSQIIENTIALVDLSFSREELIDWCISELASYDYKEVIRELLKLINVQNIEKHLDFIFDILKKAIKENPWEYQSKYDSIFSTKGSIFDLFCTIEDPQILLKIFAFIADRFKVHELKDELVEQFIKHAAPILFLHIKVVQTELLDILVDILSSDKIYHRSEKIILHLVKECKLESELFTRLLALEPDKNRSIHFLSEIADQDWFIKISEAYNVKKINADFLIVFRNWLDFEDTLLSKAFEKHIESNTSYMFADKIDSANRSEIIEFNRTKSQREFDIRFDVEELKIHIENIFHYYKKEALSYKDVDRYWDKYYDDFYLQKSITTYSIQFLREILSKDYKGRRKLHISELSDVLLEWEINRMEDILINLPDEKKTDLKINENHRIYILNWCLAHTTTAKRFLDKAVSKKTNYDFYITTVIFGFQKFFKFKELGEDLLLDMISLCDKVNKFDFAYIENIVSQDKINETILEELRDSNLENETKYFYLQYLISKGASINPDKYHIKTEITNNIKQNKYRNGKNYIELFYKNDIPFLKELVDLYRTETYEKYLLPFLLDLLIEKSEHAFIEHFLTVSYQHLVTSKTMEDAQIIKRLIKVNSEFAFIKIRELIESDINLQDFYYGSEWKTYNNYKSIDCLFKILNYYLDLEDSGVAIDERRPTIRIATETLLNIGNKGGIEICREILSKTETIETSGNDKMQRGKFYLNNFKQDLQNMIYRLKSKPYSLNEAVKLVDDHKYVFYE